MPNGETNKEEKKLTEETMPITSDEAIAKFARITQEDMASEDGQNKSLFSTKEGEYRLVTFKRKEIRSVFHDNAWWFSVIDVIEAIVETERAGRYWADLRKTLEKQGYSELPDKIGKLKMPSADGKNRETDCVETETLFRLIQSIPSKNAEPFRKWLAKIGYERILEIQDPEIAIKRALRTYELKGYPQDWIKARIQTIASRKDLTHEWKKRGIKEGLEYALLTDAISKETFGVNTKEHKEYKGLPKQQNLRDHMTPLELALTMLGETTTAELARSNDAQGFNENKTAAELGGKIAGGTRKNIEQKLKRPVLSPKNYLPGQVQTDIKRLE